MSAAIGGIYLLIFCIGALLVGICGQAVPMGANGNGNQGGGYQNGGRGGSGSGSGPTSQAGQGQGYNGQNRGGPEPAYGQNGNGNGNGNGGRGPGFGQAVNNYNNQNRGNGPAAGQGGNGQGYPNRNVGNGPSGGGNGVGNSNRGGPDYGPGNNRNGQSGKGGPPFAQGWNDSPNQFGPRPGPGNRQTGNGNRSIGQYGPAFDNNGPGDGPGGIPLSQLSPQALAGMIRFSGPRKNKMRAFAINFIDSDEPEEPELADNIVRPKNIQCENCAALLDLPIWVESENNTPIYSVEDPMPNCGGLQSLAETMDDPPPGEYKYLSCRGKGRPVGIAWRYELMDAPPSDDNSTKPDPEDLKYVRYLEMLCDEEDACSPHMSGKGDLWTGNMTDQPHNSSMCVPGDYLAGVDFTFRGELIFDVRAKCCTHAIFPNCNMEFKQLLKRSSIPGQDLCEFCKPQRPSREQLVFHQTDLNRWYTRDYRGAMHRLFLRLLKEKKEEILIHPNSTVEQFIEAEILHKCPFKGTNLSPHDHLDFWVMGGKGANGCGLPVVQRIFISEPHGIEYWSQTARAVMPKTNEAVQLPLAKAWVANDPCIKGC